MILVLGYFGFRTNQLDGQTVKTRDLFSLVKNKFNDVKYFDTQDLKFRKSSVFSMIRMLITCNVLLYLPAHNNLKYIFPIIFILSKIFKVKIYYFIIGGWLVEYLEDKPMHRWMLKHIEGIFSETNLMKDSLISKYEYKNIEVFPNFRFTEFVPQKHHESGKLKLVFLARINKMKGLDTIFSLAEKIQSKYNKNQISIDFYGPLYEPDKYYFFSELNKYDFIEYKGELQPKDINKVIELYDVMILPTHYFTEGLPGTVLDAYMSGIPIIVSKWKHADEFVDNGVTGYIIPFENNIEDLYKIVTLLYENESLLDKLKDNAYEKSKSFTAETAWSIIKNKIIYECINNMSCL